MKRLILTVALIITLVGMVNAQPTPWPNTTPELANYWGKPGGCEEWMHYFNPVTTNHLIWDPLLTSPCCLTGWWRDCGTGLPWETIQVGMEAYVELEAWLHLDWTLAEYHTASDYTDYSYALTGDVHANNPIRVCIRAYDSMPLDYLNHMTTVVCLPSTNVIELGYYYMEGTLEVPMLWDTQCALWYLTVPLCDQEFDIRVHANLDYHQPDGYYATTVCFGMLAVCL